MSFPTYEDKLTQEQIDDLLAQGWDGHYDMTGSQLYYWEYSLGQAVTPPAEPVEPVKNPYETFTGVDDVYADQQAVVDLFHESVLNMIGRPEGWASWTFLDTVGQAQLLASMGLEPL